MMNPAITAALIAASQDEESEEYIATKLREAKALGSSGAIQLDLNEKQQKMLETQLADGTVVRTIDGRLYLSERAVSDRQEGQGYLVLLVLLVAASLIASAAVLVVRSGG